MLYLLIWLVVLFGCAGAGTEMGTAVPAPPPSPTHSSSPSVPFVSTRLLPQPDPGVYQVEVAWKLGDLLADEVWVTRRNSAGKTEVLSRSGSEMTSFIDDKTSSQEYVYRVLAQVEGSATEIGAVTQRVPADWVIARGTQYWSGKSYGRVYFEKGAVLRIGSADLTADWLELHSDGGRIETFSEADRVAKGQNGWRGGAVSIHAGLAEGEIEIVSRGLDGGGGLPGAAGLAGENGKDAQPGVYQQSASAITALREGRLTISGVLRARKTLRAPAAAAAGGDGKAGERGGCGGDGGDSGGVRLIVDKTKVFWPKVSSLAGRGGAGGKGGAGGPGGKGGKGFAATADDPAHPDAANGAAGAEGPWGADGRNGKRGAVRVSLEGKTFDD